MELNNGQKITDIGLIPRDWDVKSLGEMGKFKNGINKPKEDFGFGFPFVNLMDVFGKSFIEGTESFELLNTNDSERNIYNLSEGDVIFIRSSVKPSGVGLSAVINKNLPNTVFSGFLIRYREKKFLDNGFKQHCFYEEYFRRRLISNSTVSANTNINQDALKRLLIIVPPLPEQKAIAEVLSDTDNLIQSLEKQIAKKRLIKQGAMQKLLNPNERWRINRLGEIATITMGQSPSSVFYNTSGKGIPLIQGNADIRNRKSIVRIYTSQITKRCNAGDLIMSVRAPVGEIGKASDSSCIGRGVCAIKYSNDFLYHYLIYIEPNWGKHSSGSTFDSINSDTLKAMEIPVPSLTEQEKICEILSSMDSEIDALNLKLTKYKSLKKGLMQSLLTGKIRIINK